MRTCCIFVDGENLRHAIVDLFEPEFDRKDYLPKRAKWDQWFDWLVQKACPGFERTRTYWYTVEHLDFFPYKFPSFEDHIKLRSVLSRHKPNAELLRSLSGDEFTTQMRRMVDDLQSRRAMMQRRFEGWRAIQDGIAASHTAVEFRRAGAITFDLFEQGLGTEKAVDVKLATDLIMLRDIDDCAVIVSGDQDYVPAVQVAKDSGKRVVNACFRNRAGKLLPGGARRLNMATDDQLEVTYDEMRSFLHLTRSSSPPGGSPPNE